MAPLVCLTSASGNVTASGRGSNAPLARVSSSCLQRHINDKQWCRGLCLHGVQRQRIGWGAAFPALPRLVCRPVGPKDDKNSSHNPPHPRSSSSSASLFWRETGLIFRSDYCCGRQFPRQMLSSFIPLGGGGTAGAYLHLSHAPTADNAA